MGAPGMLVEGRDEGRGGREGRLDRPAGLGVQLTKSLASGHEACPDTTGSKACVLWL